jgi:hypothetical protein
VCLSLSTADSVEPAIDNGFIEVPITFSLSSRCYCAGSFRCRHKDAWLPVPQAACTARDRSQSGLVPYWIYPVEGGALIQRHAPSLPTPQDRQPLGALRRSLAVYRLVFGQPRQDDLNQFKPGQVPERRSSELVGSLRIDLAS